MTREQKIAWLENASNEELLKQLLSLETSNKFGCNNEDIELTRNEILKRMRG
jgi:hypothetical protein